MQHTPVPSLMLTMSCIPQNVHVWNWYMLSLAMMILVRHPLERFLLSGGSRLSLASDKTATLRVSQREDDALTRALKAIGRVAILANILFIMIRVNAPTCRSILAILANIHAICLQS